MVAEGPWLELAYLLPTTWLPNRGRNYFPEVARLLRFEVRRGSDCPSTSFDLVITKKVVHRDGTFGIIFLAAVSLLAQTGA